MLGILLNLLKIRFKINIESAIFQLVILKRKNLDELKETVVFAVKQFEA